ncbi:MAG: hypothetical protein KAU28_11315 [Phycisphaerae bacterium]|nr:hypothetical protein [Phycisphaerae bacterium]
MKRTAVIVIVAITAILAVQGCTRAIKETVGMARGAKGLYTPIQPVDPVKEARPLGEYTRFELGEITDDFGGKVPADLFRLLPMEFEEALAEKKLPNEPGGKTLLIRGTILHYEDACMVGTVLGPLEEVIARLELVDKDSGKVIGKGNCIGRTTETVNQGVDKKAEGLAKAIANWIDARYPKEGREE